MENTPEELRELDQWIGVNIFGMVPIHRDEKKMADNCFVIEFIHFSKSLPLYSTDPAKAVKVLQWCLERVACPLMKTPSGYKLWHGVDLISVEAETVEITICLFSKALKEGGF